MNYIGIRVSTKETIKIGEPAGVVTNETATLKSSKDYILQFKIINYSNISTLNHIVVVDSTGSTLITPGIDINNFDIINTFEDEGITKTERLCWIKFKPPRDGIYRFGICRTLTSSDKPNTKLFDIREVSCERGTILQDFKENYKDIQSFINKTETYFEQTDQRFLLLAKAEDVNKTNAQIEVLNNNINLKVSKGEVISSINMSPEEIKLNAERIDMTGNLDLNGTFKCYKNPESKSGNYLYQSAAIHRGYLEGRQYPTFSSGIWRPDGINDMGYVSVGWTNSDTVDENGCLWMSPLAGGGAQLIFSKLLSQGNASISGITFPKEGPLRYHSYIGNTSQENIGHSFDSSISTDRYFKGEGIYSNGKVFTVSFGNNPHHLYAVNFQDEGYVYPNGNTQLGSSLNPFYQLVSKYAPEIVSDKRKKKNINYIDKTTTLSSLNNLTNDDMYNFIKDDLKLATYQLTNIREEDEDRTEIGFMVQDIKDTKVGNYIVNTKDENNYTYNMANRISVLEGALQKAIEKIEILTKLLEEKEII